MDIKIRVLSDSAGPYVAVLFEKCTKDYRPDYWHLIRMQSLLDKLEKEQYLRPAQPSFTNSEVLELAQNMAQDKQFKDSLRTLLEKSEKTLSLRAIGTIPYIDMFITDSSYWKVPTANGKPRKGVFLEDDRIISSTTGKPFRFQVTYPQLKEMKQRMDSIHKPWTHINTLFGQDAVLELVAITLHYPGNEDFREKLSKIAGCKMSRYVNPKNISVVKPLERPTIVCRLKVQKR